VTAERRSFSLTLRRLHWSILGESGALVHAGGSVSGCGHTAVTRSPGRRRTNLCCLGRFHRSGGGSPTAPACSVMRDATLLMRFGVTPHPGFKSRSLRHPLCAPVTCQARDVTGHAHDALPPAHTVEVADGVFAYVQPDGSWWLNNAGFVVGADAVTGIDASSTERRTRALLAAIGAVSRAPVRTLVNTHHHGDHTNGNCLFADAVVVGHRQCRAGVEAQVIGGLDAVFGAVEWGALTVRPPEVVFDERVDLFVGDRRVELHYIGTPAHTTGDAVAWLPEERVLFAGDLVFNGGTPFVLMGRSRAPWRRARPYAVSTRARSSRATARSAGRRRSTWSRAICCSCDASPRRPTPRG
jgi:glyoxylase-like metal-dependent hydrolase (beta-lactamase superfamily II)